VHSWPRAGACPCSIPVRSVLTNHLNRLHVRAEHLSKSMKAGLHVALGHMNAPHLPSNLLPPMSFSSGSGNFKSTCHCMPRREQSHQHRIAL
jgi:hypothetical protein